MSKSKTSEATASLNHFADAIRDCLGLGPMNRHHCEDAGADERSMLRRFYREPTSWGRADGMTPRAPRDC